MAGKDFLQRLQGDRAVLAGAAFLLACAGAPPPDPELQPEPAVAAPEAEPPAPLPNRAEALAEQIDRITKIEISDGETVLARLDAEQLAAVIAELREAEISGLSMTSPPWPGRFVEIYIEGHPDPLIASVVVMGNLRLNARDPRALAIATEDGAPDLDNIAELGPCDALWTIMTEIVGPPESREYSAPSLPL